MSKQVETPVVRFLVISGNPVGGFTFNGPFITEEEAQDFAEGSVRNDDWWTAEMEGPL